jgi:peptidoglycan/LPS O-acetylase OafA/YrhL
MWMRRSLSVYLDLLRFTAALGVVLSHAGSFVLPTEPQRIASNGAECVAVFFVLSGFVIRYVTAEKGESDWRAYTVSRVARILPVALLALLTTFVFDKVGRHFNAGFYDHGSWYASPTLFRGLIDLTFTNETWFRHSIFSSDEPYWSLGFEVPYYVLLGLCLFTEPRWRPLCVILWVAVYGLKITAYLPIWLLGVALYEYLRRSSPTPRHRLGGLALFLVGPLAYVLLKFDIGHGFYRMFEPISLRDLAHGAAYYFLIGCAVGANIIGFDRLIGERRIWPAAAERAIRWLAGGSFTLYLVHLPLLIMIRATCPWVVKNPAYGIAAICIAIAVSYAVAEIGERQKRRARTIVSVLFRAPVKSARPV